MEHITDFNNFNLNEALGVGKPSIYYNNILTHRVIKEFYKYVDANRHLGKDKTSKGSIDIKLDYDEIKPFIPKKDIEYYKFPVSDITITINFSKEDSKSMSRGGFEVPFMIGGFASPFSDDVNNDNYSRIIPSNKRRDVENVLSLHITLDILYGNKFRKMNTGFIHFENTKLFKSIESTISHEFNHLYEIYNRSISNSKPIEVAMTYTSIGDNIYNVPESVFKIWQDGFTDYIYYSESHEVNAQTQEALTFVKRLSFNRFKNHKLWKTAMSMRDWDKDEFMKDITNELNNENLDTSVIRQMILKFIDIYRLNIDQIGESPSISPDKLSKMSTDEFLTFFGKKIVKSGTTLIKNYCRLYTLNLED